MYYMIAIQNCIQVILINVGFIHCKPDRQFRSALAFNFNLHGLQHLQFLCLIPDSVNYDINWFYSAKILTVFIPCFPVNSCMDSILYSCQNSVDSKLYSCTCKYKFHTVFLSVVFLWLQFSTLFCITVNTVWIPYSTEP